MSRPRFHMACTADAAYAPFCATMLHSLLSRNADCDIVINFLHPPELDDSIKGGISHMVDRLGGAIRWHAVADAKVAGLPPMRGIERVVWYRLFLPELVPDAERILYLDADTLVMDRLRPLVETDLSGHPLAAVQNVMKPDMRQGLAQRGLPTTTRYFNSGVMLVNLAAWRADDATGKLLDLGRRHADRLIFGDQDALNMLFQDSYRPLHPRWNCQSSFEFWNEDAREVFGDAPVAEALASPAILHFEGPAVFKPWHYLYPYRHGKAYWQYLRSTGLPMPRLEGRTPRNILYKHTRWIPAPVRRALRSLVRM
jgi:lipopolysaccharide biosynthesis glycosyltransferase